MSNDFEVQRRIQRVAIPGFPIPAGIERTPPHGTDLEMTQDTQRWESRTGESVVVPFGEPRFWADGTEISRDEFDKRIKSMAAERAATEREG